MPVCEICGSKDFTLIATEIREGHGHIKRCDSCGLIIQDLDWSKDDLARYYNDEYQATNSLEAGREQTPREHFDDRTAALGSLLAQVKPLLRPDMRVLEIGCGAGELLAAIKDDVAEVVGVELFEGFVDFMNDELGIEAYAQDVNTLDLGDRKFDLIISIATLDHLPNPLETLATMKGLLAPGGIVYVEVPNRDEALNFYLPEPHRTAFNIFFWHRAHLFYFTRETLEALMKKAALAASIEFRHEYTLMNYLHWYLTGRPMATFISATRWVVPFIGDSPFEQQMNGMFEQMETRFHEIMAATGAGDTLCCVARAAE